MCWIMPIAVAPSTIGGGQRPPLVLTAVSIAVICLCLCCCCFAYDLNTGCAGPSLRLSCRLVFARAREGYLLHLLAMIHTRRRSPILALTVTLISALLILCTSDIYTLINYMGFVHYLFYGITVAGLIVLRVQQPSMHQERHWPSPVWLVTYLLFRVSRMVFSLYSGPTVCGVDLAIMMTAAPVYFLGVYWENKPRCYNPAS